MASERTIRFYPTVDGSSVAIAWDDPAFSRHFKRPGIRIDYHTAFDGSEPLVTSLAAGLVAPLVGATKEPGADVRVLIDGPAVPRALELWQAYHAPAGVHVEATGAASPGSALAKPLNAEGAPDPRPTALLYGGGKDSLAALGLFRELRPGGEIDILRLHWLPPSPARHREAFERHCLPSLQATLPVGYRSCSIDLHSNCRSPKLPHHLHMGLFFAAFLPILACHNYSELNFSYDCLDYFKIGKSTAYRRGHPRVFGIINSMFREHDIDTRVRNVSFGLTPGAHFAILQNCYPRLLNTIYSCESVNGRWCNECIKCFTFALFCVTDSVRPDHFDVNEFLSTSLYFQAVCENAHAVSTRHRGPVELLPCVKELSDANGFLAVRNRLDQLRFKLPRIRDISLEAIRKLSALVDLLAISDHRELNAGWESAIRYEAPHEDAERLIHILNRAGVDVVKDPVIRNIINGRSVEYSYEQPPDLPLAMAGSP